MDVLLAGSLGVVGGSQDVSGGCQLERKRGRGIAFRGVCTMGCLAAKCAVGRFPLSHENV